MKYFSFPFIILFSLQAYSQNNFIIRGKIERLSKSQNIIITGPVNFTAPIQEDGSFEIIGELTEAGSALIKTDSSAADGIWLEPGDYDIFCKEITQKNSKWYLFRTSDFKGPKDAEIKYGFSQPRYYIKGSTREETMQKHKEFSIHYIDSILKNYPGSKALPGMIRLSQYYIGDEATQTYLSLLSTDQKGERDSKRLEDYFKRKEKMVREKVFENFSMKDDKGKDFKLSSVTDKKLILIDFWASWCGPCRHKHKKLVELYEKYSAKGLEIVSVSLDDNKDEWLKAIQKDNMNWINIAELKGWETSLALNYFIKSLPYVLWLDGSRKIIGAELSEKEIGNYLSK